MGFASADSMNCGSKTVFSTHGWESADMEGQLYALNGVEHPQVFMSMEILEPIP